MSYLFYILIAELLVFITYIISIRKIVCNKIWLGRKYNCSINIAIFILAIILTAIAVLRKIDNSGLGGSDAFYYMNVFYNPDKYFSIESIFRSLDNNEPFYYFLAWLFSKFTNQYKVFFAVIYFAICLMYLYVLVKNELHYKLSIIPLFYFIIPYLHSFNVVRFSLAVSIGLLAGELFNKKKYLIAGVFFVIAIICHMSMLTFLTLVLFCKIFFGHSTKRPWYVVILFLFFSLCQYSLTPFLNKILTHLGYMNYLNVKVSVWGVLPTIICFLLAFYFYKDIMALFRNNHFYLNMVMCNFAFIPVFCIASFSRINDIFCIYRLVIWSAIIKVLQNRFFKCNRKNKELALIIIMLLCMLWTCFRIFRMSRSKIIPYVFDF